VNESELDELLAAAAPIDDADLAARLLWGPDDDLCEAIMSTPVIETTDAAAPDRRRPRRPRRPRRWLAAGAAAAAFAAVTSAAVLTADPGSRVDAATVQNALTNLGEALDGSGRAEVHESSQPVDPGDGPGYEGVWNLAISGADSEATYDEDVIKRVVDGETYYALHPDGDGAPGTTPDQWIHLPDDDGWAVEKTAGWWAVEGQPDGGTLDVPPNLDPQDMLSALSPAGSFDEVGDEDVDGVPTRRLRATNPGATPTLSFGNVVYDDATVTALEVWVDDDDVVRRLDITLDVPAYESGPDELTGWPRSINTYSIRFSELGAPISIDPPADYEELTP